MLNIFEFSHVKEIVESWLVYANKVSNYPVMFHDRDNKTKLVPAFFSYFVELMRVK